MLWYVFNRMFLCLIFNVRFLVTVVDFGQEGGFRIGIPGGEVMPYGNFFRSLFPVLRKD